ncbi:MAG: hypothetical protein ABJB40_05175 [Acidobacteriota bacterium]
MNTKVIVTVIWVGVLVGFTEASAQTRIRFAKGRTSASVAGQIGGRAARKFVLGARDGQTLSGNVSSTNGCVKFTEGATSTSFTTKTGDNRVTITNTCGSATSYVLTVSIID